MHKNSKLALQNCRYTTCIECHKSLAVGSSALLQNVLRHKANEFGEVPNMVHCWKFHVRFQARNGEGEWVFGTFLKISGTTWSTSSYQLWVSCYSPHTCTVFAIFGAAGRGGGGGGSNISAGAVTGIVVGCIAVVCVIALVSMKARKRNHTRRNAVSVPVPLRAPEVLAQEAKPFKHRAQSEKVELSNGKGERLE